MTRTEAANDQYFQYLIWGYDVSAAQQIVKDREPNAVLRVADVARMLPPDPKSETSDRLFVTIGAVEVDWGHVANLTPAQMEIPVIIAETARTKSDPDTAHHLPIDGWHRIAYANWRGIETLPAHVLSLAETQQILDPRSGPLIPEPDPEFTDTIDLTARVWFQYKALARQGLGGEQEDVLEVLRSLSGGEFDAETTAELFQALRFRVLSAEEK